MQHSYPSGGAVNDGNNLDGPALPVVSWRARLTAECFNLQLVVGNLFEALKRFSNEIREPSEDVTEASRKKFGDALGKASRDFAESDSRVYPERQKVTP